MGEPFIGKEAVASGRLTASQLRSRWVAIYPGIYVARDTVLTPKTRAKAAWLWSDRRGVIAGRSAAALHGSKWLDARHPAELIYDNRRPPGGYAPEPIVSKTTRSSSSVECR